MSDVKIVRAMQIKKSSVHLSKGIILLTFFANSYPTMILPLCFLSGNTDAMSYLVIDDDHILFESSEIFETRYKKLSDGFACVKIDQMSC